LPRAIAVAPTRDRCRGEHLLEVTVDAGAAKALLDERVDRKRRQMPS
jgi:hypothetical protein